MGPVSVNTSIQFHISHSLLGVGLGFGQCREISLNSLKTLRHIICQASICYCIPDDEVIIWVFFSHITGLGRKCHSKFHHIKHISYIIFTGRERSCGKIIFLHLFVSSLGDDVTSCLVPCSFEGGLPPEEGRY